MTISHKIINEQFFMSFPYELKDTFRTLFKTAKWNPAHKAFVAANTHQNHKKWERFVQAADTANRLFAQKDHDEVTAKELQEQIGRAPCREGVCKSVSLGVVPVYLRQR